MLTYKQVQVNVMPLRNALDLKNMELYLRTVFRTDPTADCHALRIASYIEFRNQCLRAMRADQTDSFEATLLDGYCLQYHDANVMVKRLVFDVMDDTDMHDCMDI